MPLTIAIHLSKNQRFAEAQRWFHYVFDPTDDSDGPTPERFWKVRPFQYTDVEQIEEILVNLATGARPRTLRDDTIRSIEAWKDAPFRPHVVARYRQSAYMFKTVMAYLDNLIAWGDSLFRQDTGEAINEAMQLYVLAANILGPRPQAVPRQGDRCARRPTPTCGTTWTSSATRSRDLEADIPFDLLPLPARRRRTDDRLGTLRSLGTALYFCVPRNDKLLGYWDTVADRLFKIRNSLNLQGIFRQLAAVRAADRPGAAGAGRRRRARRRRDRQRRQPAAAAGALPAAGPEGGRDLPGGQVAGRATCCGDGEGGRRGAGVLRARHERELLEMVESVRYGQLQEAIKNREGLRAVARRRRAALHLLRAAAGQAATSEITVPELATSSGTARGRQVRRPRRPSSVPRPIDDRHRRGIQGRRSGYTISSCEARGGRARPPWRSADARAWPWCSTSIASSVLARGSRPA